MGRGYDRPCYPCGKDGYDKEFPLFTWPFSTDTCYEEIDCILEKVTQLR